MALVQSYYGYKGKTENKFAGEGGLTGRYGSRYGTAYFSVSYSCYKEKVECSVAAYKRRRLS